MNDTSSFSERMRAQGRTWNAILGHRFFREVATDAIDDRVFVRYLRIEYGFVDTAARVLGYAVLPSATSSPSPSLLMMTTSAAAPARSCAAMVSGPFPCDAKCFVATVIPLLF